MTPEERKERRRAYNKLHNEKRAHLVKSPHKVKADYDTIMIFSTLGDKGVVPSTVPEIKMWLVNNGRVSPVAAYEREAA